MARLPPKTIAVFAFAITGLILSGAVLRAWRSGAFDQWEEKTIRASLAKLQPLLPFEIEKIEIRKEWREFFSGRIAQLSLVLRKDSTRAYLSGPLRVSRLVTEGYRVEYDPETRVELTGAKDQPDPFLANLWIETSSSFGEIRVLGIKAQSKTKSWKFEKLELEKPTVEAEWKAGKAHLEAKLEAARLNQGELQAEAKDLALEVDSELSLQPFSIAASSKTIRGKFVGRSAEALWGERYFDLPLSDFPLRFEASFPLASATVSLPLSGKRELQLRGELPGTIHWNLPSTSLPSLLDGIQKHAPGLLPAELSNTLARFQIKAGEIESHGKYAFGQNALPSGTLQVRKLALRMPETSSALRGLSLEVTREENGSVEGTLAAQDLYFKKLHAKLDPTPFSLAPTREGFDLRVGETRNLPLHVDGLELELRSLSGSLGKAGLQAQTSLSLPVTPLAEVLRPLCIDPGKLPPTDLSIEFPRIDFGPDWIEPSGKVRASLLGGTIEASAMSFYELGTEVPEVSFDAFMKGIRLDRVGEWLKLGEIDGVLNGEATNVTFLSWLPTEYYASFEAKPMHHKKVVFSPKAMKNFLRSVGAKGIDGLPGIVDWYAFGWPREKFGGYDIEWLGISLSAENGFIQVRTPESAEVLQDTGKHFILYSSRDWTTIRIPLPGPHYPLIVSAPAMADYVRGLLDRYGLLDKPESLKESASHENCEPPAL